MNPGFRSRIARHIDFPDYGDGELLSISETMLERPNYSFAPPARAAMQDYIARRLIAHEGPVRTEMLMEIAPADILASRVFKGVPDSAGPEHG
jgi:hypothetical protein